MFKQSDILNEKNGKTLREVSSEVTFPMDKKYIELMDEMINYLRLSQDEEYANKNHIRAGMGLAAIQLGVKKRFFVICYKMDDGSFVEYKVVNPKIISNSSEQIYVEEGEGGLSVTHDIPGIVPRYARVNVSFYDENGHEVNVRVREEIAVAFQHEIDHLNGILYIDKIDRKNPYKDADKMRAI